ncbi:MAG: hypothetical protein ACREF5_00525 [Candidatus Saccharimonadales bacterium]
MSDDYITRDDLDESVLKIIKHIDKQSRELREVIAKIDHKYDQLLTTLDKFLKRLDDIESNDAGRDAQLARHERWLEQIAAKTGVKLEY